MADEGLRIVNSVDNSQVKSSFADMRREIVNSAQTAQAEGKKIDNAIDRVALTAATASDQLKKKIYEASQTVNTLSAKIIEQKDVVREVQAYVRKLGEEYKKALKNGSIGASGKLAEFNAAKKALEEEKAALFGLNQERSKAQLKVKELRGQMELLKKTSDDGAQAVEFLKRGLAAIGGFQALKGFTAQVIQTRGEFQQLEVAFTTMLGSAEKANALMMQLTKTAAVTPFDLKGVTDGAKQLLAYGVAADEVNDTLIHLGDIAAGLSLPLGDLVYLYGTTLTQGRMFTQDLRQFMGRGIPIAEELAKQFGVTKDKVQELVSTGKVGAEEFKQAIMAMSSEGGKFGGLMEEQSKTITGQISNIEDAIDNMFNEIGKNSEGVINDTLEGVSYLVENYEKVGKVILSVAGVYGIYKAAVLSVIAAEKIAALARLAHIRQQTLLQLATDILTKKMALLNATMLTNPWVLATTAIAGLIAVMINLETQAERVKKAEEDLNDEREKAIQLEEEHKAKINELIQIAGDESLSTDNRRSALIKLEQQYPAIFAKYDTEAEKLAHILEIKNAIAEADGKKSVTNPKNEYAKNQAEIDKLLKKGKATYTTQTTSYGMAYTYQTGGRTSEDEARLTALQNRQKVLSQQIDRDKGNEYMKNLTGVSNEDLQAQINARKNLLAKMKLEGKKYGTTTTGGVKGTFTADELQGQLQVMQSEINRRNEATYTPAQRKAQLASELASAKKALADFDKTSSKFTVSEAEAQRKKLQDAVSDAEKKYKAMGGDTSNSKAESAAKKREADEKRRQANEKAIAQEIAQLNASTELAVIESKEDGVKKRLELADYEHKQELAKIDNKHADLVEKRGGNLTAEEEAAFTKAREQADKDYHDKEQQIITEEWNAKYDAMRDYLKEYGTLEQQRLAITQEYEEKIQQATTPTGRAALMLERNQALKDFDAKQFEEQIDWSGIFSDLQGHTQEYLIGLRDQLQGVLNEGNLTPEQMSVVQEKLRDLNDEISKKNGLFQFQGDRAREHTRLVQEATDAQARLNQAKKEESDAQKNVLDATNQIRDMLEVAGIYRDTDIDDEILTQFDANSEEYKQMSKLLEQLRIGEGNLAKARKGTEDATNKAKNAEDAKQREFSQAVADWFSDAQQFITEKGIDQTPALLDEFGLGAASEKVSQGLSGFNNAAGAATDFASGNYIGAALKGFSALKNFSNMLGFGGDSDKHLQEDIERLTASNEALKYSIDELSDKMSESAVVDAEAIYKQQKEQLDQSEKNTQEMMSRSAKAYSNGFLGIGGHRSSNTKINNSMSSSEWDRISNLLGKNVRSAGEFFNLTSEQMYKVAVELPDVYSHIKDLANDGYKDAAKYMDQYLEYAKQREELEKAYMEKLTSVSFDSIQNEFASALMDMDSDAETFAESFEKYMQQAIINSLVSEQYRPLLEKWYKAFGSFMSDGDISEDEMRKLRETGGTYYDPSTGRSESFQSWSSMSDSALAMRDTLKDVFGWNSSAYKQEASTKGFQAMSQDTGDELNGRFTAMVSLQAETKDLTALQNELLTQLNTCGTGIKTSVEALQTALATSNIHLSDIAKYTKELQGSKEILEEIRDNTKHL